jgi:hypothetical protein
MLPMTVNDPTAQDPLAEDALAEDALAEDALAHNTSGARNSRLASVVASILLTVHVLLFGATIMMVGLLVMITAPCSGPQRCRDPAWIDRALTLSLWAGGAMLFADLAVAVLRLARQRVAWFVPVIGCVAQLALALGAAAMGSLAGPVS